MNRERGSRCLILDWYWRVVAAAEADIYSRAIERMSESEKTAKPMIFVSTPAGRTNKFWEMIEARKGETK